MALFLIAAYMCLWLTLAFKFGSPKTDKTNGCHFDGDTNQTQYNPATGLPMIGSLDSMGNSIGSYSSDINNNWINCY